MLGLKQIRDQLAQKFLNEDFVIDKSGVKTVELIGAVFEANDKTIFGEPSFDYIKKEIDWYYSRSLNTSSMRGKVPKIWEDVSDRNGYVNSNYGWCIFSNKRNADFHNHDQYGNVLDALKKNLDTRQAVMIYTRPTMHYDAFADGMHDFMCTNTVQYLVRDGVLHAVVNMRSNDAIFGYRNDWAWQHHIAHKLVNDLSKNSINLNDEPKIIWQTGSLHVYERHFDLIEDYISNRAENNSNE